MSYAPHDQLVLLARPSRSLWRVIVGFLCLIALIFALGYGAFEVAYAILPADLSWRIYDESEVGDTPFGVAITLGLFAIATIALEAVMRLFHRRGVLELLGDLPQAVRDFIRVMAAFILLSGLLTFLPSPDYGEPVPNLHPGQWLLLLPLMCVFLFIQISAEELVFRGYLQSQLAARFTHPAIWIGLPSVLFGLLHWGNAETTEGSVAYVLATTAFGMAAADLTARTGTLGAALGLHFAVNFYAIFLVAFDDWAYGYALFVIPLNGTPLEHDPLIELAVILNIWLAARVALRR
ncbi:CPBP family intramembrane glutamic endopeptidase [Aestuariibius sp. 2305UL40-4]|uniref:CPBP family intramembrane glutamic endopeptidase n=1 Tax=Aestuariibius violaceus TaxID=3234132 RepID=UPI00345E8C30